MTFAKVLIKNMCFNQRIYGSVTEVSELLHELSSGKASSMDGLTGESLKYANHTLPVLLLICFTCIFKHCYLPISMLDSVLVVPLVKTEVASYRTRITTGQQHCPVSYLNCLKM